jgi:DNA-binding transcriptional LysR family regulator
MPASVCSNGWRRRCPRSRAAIDGVNSLRQRPVGRLRLNVPGIVARFVLPPIVTPFLKAYPGITLEVASNDALMDVLAAGFDARHPL